MAIKARAIFDLVKPELPLAAGICVVAGEVIASKTIPPLFVGLMGFLTGVFISGAAMILNDYFDLEVDKINHPQRPLPSGRVSTLDVFILTSLFSVAGFMTATLISPIALILTAAIWIVGVLYNWRFKETGLLGNMMVALSVAWTFIAGGVAVGGLTNGIIWIFGAMAFVFDLGEEIASGAMDIKGDAQRSVRSIARMHGKDHALRVSGLLFVTFVVLGFIPFVMGWLSSIFLILFMPMDFACLYLTMKLHASQTVNEGRARLRQLYLMNALFIVAFVVFNILSNYGLL